jgi:NADH:quinone reductase (non-electrogenic)
MSHVLIVGGGFAGVWSAASAAKLRRECGATDADLSITVVNAGDDLVIRPRLYESAPHTMRVPLDQVLGPIGVQRLTATVTGIDTVAKTATAVSRDGRSSDISYDRLVLASGSQVVQPKVPGAGHMFDVDTLAGAARLDSHLHRLPERNTSAGQYTVVVVGAGFTGLEIATELTRRLREIADSRATVCSRRRDGFELRAAALRACRHQRCE